MSPVQACLSRDNSRHLEPLSADKTRHSDPHFWRSGSHKHGDIQENRDGTTVANGLNREGQTNTRLRGAGMVRVAVSPPKGRRNDA
jgi:hypothetical protein